MIARNSTTQVGQSQVKPKAFGKHLGGFCQTYWLRLVLVVAVTFGFCGYFTKSEPVQARDRSGSIISSVVKSDTTVDVSGDDSLDAYRGTGGLLLPTTFSGNGSTRKQIASCLECVWRYTLYCDRSSDVFCGHAVTTCRSGQIKYRVWFGKTRLLTKVVGSVCWGKGRPATRSELETQVNSAAIRHVPALKPGVAPRGSTYTSVPILVWSGQPAMFKPELMFLGGHRVQIRATALWHWVWGDGKGEWTAAPGAAYPLRSLGHQYRKPGTYRVRVSTVWQANYEVSGIGTFAARGDLITQSAQFPVNVLSARAVLVAK